MSDDEDDKPTVILDLNALKNEKIKEEESLAHIAEELEFTVGSDDESYSDTTESENSETLEGHNTTIILFDYEDSFFQYHQEYFPSEYQYKLASGLAELNECLSSHYQQIVVFNYDENPKVVNHLSTQIKQKFPSTLILIMASSISPNKAKRHAQTPAGAHGYYQYPLETEKISQEFQKLENIDRKVG